MHFRFSQRDRIHLALTILLLFVAGCQGDSETRDGADSRNADAGLSEESRPSGTAEATTRRRILFFGDSITAGYGLDPADAFPALIQEKIDDREWPFEAVNAGLSGETSAGGLRRIDWMLKQPVDVFVLELGGNDGLRGIPAGGTRHNLKKIVDRVSETYPDAAIVIAGMRMPPNLGRMFAQQFADVFPEVAEETGATLIPFIGEDVAGRDNLLQMDGIHPTSAGHEVISETVWKYLEPILRERMENGE